MSLRPVPFCLRPCPAAYDALVMYCLYCWWSAQSQAGSGAQLILWMPWAVLATAPFSPQLASTMPVRGCPAVVLLRYRCGTGGTAVILLCCFCRLLRFPLLLAHVLLHCCCTAATMSGLLRSRVCACTGSRAHMLLYLSRTAESSFDPLFVSHLLPHCQSTGQLTADLSEILKSGPLATGASVYASPDNLRELF